MTFKVLLYLYVMLYHDAEIAPSQLQSQHSGKSEYFRPIHSVLPNPWNQELVDQILNWEFERNVTAIHNAPTELSG